MGLAPSPGSEKADILNAAELRVVLLAGNGHTNRKIAAALFTTVSTIEQRLTHFYRKLGVKVAAIWPAHLSVALRER